MKPATVAKPAPLVAVAITQEGTGPERVWLALRLTLEGERVVKREVIDRTRWRDVAEDAARRVLWGKALPGGRL